MTLGEFQRVKIKLSMNERISKSQIENRIEHSNSVRKAYKLHVDCMQITCKSHGQRAKGRIVNRSQMRDPHASPTESSHHPQNPRILSHAHHPHNPRMRITHRILADSCTCITHRILADSRTHITHRILAHFHTRITPKINNASATFRSVRTKFTD